MKIEEKKNDEFDYIEVSFPEDKYIIKIAQTWDTESKMYGKVITFQEAGSALAINFTAKQWIDFLQEIKEDL